MISVKSQEQPLASKSVVRLKQISRAQFQVVAPTYEGLRRGIRFAETVKLGGAKLAAGNAGKRTDVEGAKTESSIEKNQFKLDVWLY